jgi:hypothetical protein
VQSLEEPVRRYLVEREVAREGDTDLRTDESESGSSSESLDSEDEEIVFVGRNGSMRDGGSKARGDSKRAGDVGGQWKKAHREDKGTGATRDEGMLFDGFADEDGGAFRYVVVSPAFPPLGILTLFRHENFLKFANSWSFRYACIRRWITHSISDYYGLQSRSVLMGNPQRKVVYVCVKQMRTGRAAPPVVPVRAELLPRPLWELC